MNATPTLAKLRVLNTHLKRHLAREAKSAHAKFNTFNNSTPVQLASSVAAPYEQIRLESALAHLSPDVGRGNGTFFDATGQLVSDYWLAAVWAIRSLGWPSGKATAMNWSQQCRNRYDEHGFETAWNSYDPNHPNPIRIGSLYKYATLRGWKTPDVLPKSINSSRYQLLGRSALQGMPPVIWRVKGIFPAQGLGAIFGPSGAGKSFLAFDMAAAIASGTVWFGHRTQAASVIYVALEGESGYRNRVTAWEKERLQPLPPSLHLVMQSFKLTEPQDIHDLVAVIPKGAVVFIDTLNRAAPTADENSSKDMGAILEGAKSLQTAISGLVVLIHHTGKDASKGARGHSSFTAALDGAIEVERSINGRAWNIAKAKDGEDGNKTPFKLNTHTLGNDGDGDAVTSCTVEQDLSAVFKPIEPKGHQQKSALKAIRSSLGQSQIKGKAGCGNNTTCIPFATAVSAVVATIPTVDKHRRSNRANQLISSLTANGFLLAGLEGDDGWLWAP